MVPYWVFFGAPLLVSILETTDYFLMRGEADWPARTWFQAYIRVYNLHPSKVSGIDAKTESIRSIIAQLEQILVPGYYIVGTVFQMSMFPATLNREETSCMASYKRPYDRNLGDLIPHVVNSLAANLPVHRIYHHFRNRQDPRGFVEMVMRDSATNGNGQEPSDSRIQPSPRPVAVVTNPRTEGKPTMQTQPISSAIDTQHDAEGGSDDSGETVRLGILIEQLSITPPESSDDSPFIEPGEVVDIPEDPKQDPPPWEA